jgi:hypothetical protein
MTDSPLDREIEIVESLIEQEFAAGRVSSCNALATTLGRLKKTRDDMSIRSSRTYSQGAVIRMAQGIGDILLDELSGLDNFEALLDRIQDRILLTVSSSQNSDQEKAKLLGRDHH